MAAIHIGTSGWSYKHWRGIFYSPGLKPALWLPFYAQHFLSTEINNSFYGLPKPDTVLQWIKNVPSDFTFCVKMNRFLTHMKKLTGPEEPLQSFFEVFEPMKSRMGPVLVQLPPSLHFNYDKAAYFYELISKKYKDYEFVLEARHQSWLEDDSLTLMAKYNIGMVIAQSGERFPYSEMVTDRNIYVRFHGPKELYASPYTDEQLESFAAKFRNWMAEGHDIWVYFNNDFYGHAFRDAAKLRKLMGQGGRGPEYKNLEFDFGN
jgi:uncharacterized protein YecE (DUF72 family)